jgi:phage shock protein C
MATTIRQSRTTVLTPAFDAIRQIPFRRSRPRLLGGIVAALAARTNLNVWLLRLIVLISFALPVLGVGLYLAAWALLPWEDESIPVERWIDSAISRQGR